MKATLRRALELIGLDYDLVENHYPSTLSAEAIVFITGFQHARDLGKGVTMLAALPLSGELFGDFILKNRAIVLREHGKARVVLEWG